MKQEIAAVTQVTFVEYVRQSGGWNDCAGQKSACGSNVFSIEAGSGEPQTESGFYNAKARHAWRGCAGFPPYADKLLRTFLRRNTSYGNNGKGNDPDSS